MDHKTSSEDAELVVKVSEGDRKAFLKLYDRYARRVYGLALRMLGERGIAEEVSQETFLKLWSRAASFNPTRGSLKNWLLVITRRTAIDRIRFESRRPPLVDIENKAVWMDMVDPESSSEEARWQSLHFALLDLPSEQKQVIELAFYHGMSHRQIADHLRAPLGTVKTRIRLGMEKLRRSWLGSEDLRSERSTQSQSGVAKDRKRYTS